MPRGFHHDKHWALVGEGLHGNHYYYSTVWGILSSGAHNKTVLIINLYGIISIMFHFFVTTTSVYISLEQTKKKNLHRHMHSVVWAWMLTAIPPLSKVLRAPRGLCYIVLFKCILFQNEKWQQLFSLLNFRQVTEATSWPTVDSAGRCRGLDTVCSGVRSCSRCHQHGALCLYHGHLEKFLSWHQRSAWPLATESFVREKFIFSFSYSFSLHMCIYVSQCTFFFFSESLGLFCSDQERAQQCSSNDFSKSVWKCDLSWD